MLLQDFLEVGAYPCFYCRNKKKSLCCNFEIDEDKICTSCGEHAEKVCKECEEYDKFEE